MKHMPLLLGLSALLLTASSAMATEPSSVRLGAAVAIDGNQPQDTRFGPGGAGSLKLTFDLLPWLDVAPSLMTDQFAPQSAYSASGVSGLWAVGGGLRIKRPHNANDRSYWQGTSPWIDADAQYIRTGDLNRLGLSVGVGLAAPMDSARHVWLGPAIRYTDVVDGTSFGGNAALDHTDAHIVTFGLELEFDFAGQKKVAPPTPVAQVPSKPAVDQLPTPKVAVVRPDVKMEQKLHLSMAVPFAFDSAVVTAVEKNHLDELAAVIVRNLAEGAAEYKEFSAAVEIDGYASSENHPNKEAYNQALSVRRANQVKTYLISKGVPASVLTVKGFGTANPVAPNDTEAHRKLNRRVEFGVDVKVTIAAPQGK